MAHMRRWITTRPAYDCIRVQPCQLGSERCIPGSGGSHGVHSVDMCWYVADETSRGPAAVQFLLFTGWHRDETYAFEERRPLKSYNGKFYNPLTPMAADLGYHSPFPTYEGQDAYGQSDCKIIGQCYYDGSSLNAEEPWRILRHDGGEALWEYLEEFWASLFIEAVVA